MDKSSQKNEEKIIIGGMVICNMAHKCKIETWSCFHKTPHVETKICSIVPPDVTDCKGKCIPTIVDSLNNIKKPNSCFTGKDNKLKEQYEKESR